MHAVCRDGEPLAGPHGEAAQLHGAGGHSDDGGRRRIQPQALLQARLQVGKAARAQRCQVTDLACSSAASAKNLVVIF